MARKYSLVIEGVSAS